MSSRLVLLAILVVSTSACRSAALPAAVVTGLAAPNVPAPRAGRGTIVGVVADSTDGYQVVGGSVYFTADTVIGVGRARPRTDLPRATTDAKGGFALRDLVPGRYTLAFSDLDHFPMRQIVVVESDRTHTLVLRPARRAKP